MKKWIAPLALLGLWATVTPAAAEFLEGTIVAIDATQGKFTVGGADIVLKSVKIDGFKVGDQVRVEYTQDDVHDPYVLKSIVKK